MLPSSIWAISPAESVILDAMNKKLAKILLVILLVINFSILGYQFANYLIEQIERSKPAMIIRHDSGAINCIANYKQVISK